MQSPQKLVKWPGAKISMQEIEVVDDGSACCSSYGENGRLVTKPGRAMKPATLKE